MKNYLHTKKPDIVFLNEIKVGTHSCGFFMDFLGYDCEVKPRNQYGGGVAVLVRHGLKYIRDNTFDKFELELVAIKLNLFGTDLSIVTLYNPPSSNLSTDFFDELLKKSAFLLGGDLNSKHEEFGCKTNNSNGIFLNELIERSDIHKINDDSPTFHLFRPEGEYTEILDLFLCSHDLLEKVERFQVDYDYDMTSDHFPIEVSFSMSYCVNNPLNKSKFNYNLANWELFKGALMSNPSDVFNNNLSIDELAQNWTDNVIRAANLSIPKMGEKVYKTSFPLEIVSTIKERRKARRLVKKYNTASNRANYNRLTALLRLKIKNHRNESWTKFIEKVGKNQLSSRPFWIKINKFRKNKQKKMGSMPTLSYDNKIYETNEEKADLFSSLLAKTFSPNDLEQPFFDDEVKSVVDKFKNDHTNLNGNITIDEIKTAIFQSKKDSSAGMDLLHNQMLRNLPYNALEEMRHLFNKSITQNRIPEIWKTAKITLIPKKQENKSDPNSYRPISVSSCAGKILERVICSRLYYFLESNKLLTKNQSGFRKHRRTSDNLFFMTQKVAESFNRGKSVCALFFDISKAFDKVWHDGLVYKLIKLNVPPYLVMFIISFLNRRSFRVFVDGHLSGSEEIRAGVPQGAPLSPILFSIYINDVPQKNVSNVSQSLLFADDLETMFFFKKQGNIESQINRYLSELEKWLMKWKMKIATNKCSYLIFTQNTRVKPELNLLLHGEAIPCVTQMKFLGLTFDNRLNFKPQVNEIRKKCKDRLNIIKILSGRHWNLKPSVLGGIYKSLIGSVIDYSFMCLHLISESDLSKLQAIQNNAIRSIFHLPFDYSNAELARYRTELNLDLISHRLDGLSDRYIASSLEHNNELFVALAKEYRGGFTSRDEKRATPLSGSYLILDKYL